MIPIDVANADDDELWTNSINLNRVVEAVREQAPNATHYIVFDACRNELNLTLKGKRALAERGFVPIAYTPGVMIAYATAPGKTATDVGVGAGIYAKALAEEIVKPGLEAVTMFRRVALRVYREIGQDPWMAASTLPEVYFAGEAATPAALVAPEELKEQQLTAGPAFGGPTPISLPWPLTTRPSKKPRLCWPTASERSAAAMAQEPTRSPPNSIARRGVDPRVHLHNRLPAGEPTGVWRRPPGNSDARNYYLIVEAIAPDGRKLSLPIRNEENGITETVAIFGVRVSREVYEAVAQDRLDDGIVQRNQFGVKRRGKLAIEYQMPFDGGFITKW